MSKRLQIPLGMAGGLLWAIAVLWIGPRLEQIQIPLYAPALTAVAALIAGLPLAAMIGRIAQRRFFDDTIIDGQPLTGPAEIDQRVLQNTTEQLVLAAFLWPVAGVVLGMGTVLALAITFLTARLMFWIGYHISPPLRGLGFAATFYPTVLAALVSVGVALT